jgi:hypothetical protein
MKQESILLPVAALAVWTLLVLLLIPLRRFGAAKRGLVTAHDFKYGESERVPPDVSIPNRHLMNLLEMPLLFYVSALLLYVTKSADSGSIALAWAYVAMRLGHSAVHLTYNKVMHRLGLFALSNAVLTVIWFRIVMQLLNP